MGNPPNQNQSRAVDDIPRLGQMTCEHTTPECPCYQTIFNEWRLMRMQMRREDYLLHEHYGYSDTFVPAELKVLETRQMPTASSAGVAGPPRSIGNSKANGATARQLERAEELRRWKEQNLK